MEKPAPKCEIHIRRIEGDARLWITYASEDVFRWLEQEIEPMCNYFNTHSNHLAIDAHILPTYDPAEVVQYIKSYGNVIAVVDTINGNQPIKRREE
jgi:hypothetical protein